MNSPAKTSHTETAPARSRFVITGPTGWIGQAFLDLLARRPGLDWDRDVALFGSQARAISGPDGRTLPLRALSDITADDVDDATVIHLAYLTKDKAAGLDDGAFLQANTAIDLTLLHALEGARPRALFVASSGAAADAERGPGRHIYGVAKLLQEDRFLAHGRAFPTRVLVGRVYNIAGPFINKWSAYALSSLIQQARETGRMTIQADRPVFRSYLHVSDLCRLVLDGLAADEPLTGRMDLCGPRIVEMNDVALAVARATGVDPGQIHRAPLRFDVTNAYLGDSLAVQVAALKQGHILADFETQVADTLQFMSTVRT